MTTSSVPYDTDDDGVTTTVVKGLMTLKMIHEKNWLVIFIILGGSNIVLNFLTVVIICTSQQLRGITGQIMKASIACADLMMGFLHLLFYSKLVAIDGKQGCFQTTPLETMAELLGYFVVGWTLVALNLIDTFKKRATACAQYMSAWIEPTPRCKYFCVLPWFVGSCIVVPVVMTSAEDYDLPHLDEVRCIGHLPESILITFFFIALHLPCYLNVAYLITLLVCRCRRCNGTRLTAKEQDSAIEETIHDQENVFLSTFPVIAYVTCLLPLVIYTWAWFLYGWPASKTISAAVTVCLLSRSSVQSVSCLGCRDFRREVKRVGRRITTHVCRLFRQIGTSTQASVTYDVLHESQTLCEL